MAETYTCNLRSRGVFKPSAYKCFLMGVARLNLWNFILETCVDRKNNVVKYIEKNRTEDKT